MTTYKTSDICDACAEAQACELSFISLGRRRAFAGAIRTVRYDGGLGVMRDLLRQPGQGQVLVIDGGGLRWRALFGDIMAGMAAAHGWEGVVVHGAVRDRAEIDGMDIGVKALAIIPRRAEIRAQGDLDVSVSFGGVVFAPGARLIADEDGVVVLPMGLSETDISIADAVAATAAYARDPGLKADH